MLKNKRFTLLLIILLILGICSSVYADDDDVKIVYGDKPFVLANGDEWKGDVLVLGGNASISPKAEVKGDVTLFGGTLLVEGTIQGDLTAFSGIVKLTDTAEVRGDLTALNGKIERSPEAFIRGDIVESNADSENGNKWFSFNTMSGFGKTGSKLTGIFGLLLSAAMMFLKILVITGASVLLTLLFEKQIAAAAGKIPTLPLQSFGVGFAAYALMIILTLALCLTVLGIPLAVLVILMILILGAYAEIIVGSWLGQLVCKALKLSWSAVPVNAIGTFLVCAAADGFAKLIPCIGWIPNAAVCFLGLGAVCIRWFNLFNDPKKPLPPRNSAPGDPLQLP